MKNKYEILGGITKIYIRFKLNIFEVLIDTDDLPLVSSVKTTWNLNRNRTGHFDGVRTKVQNNKKRVQYWMHRLIVGFEGEGIVDHINGNVFDNRRSNLRIVNGSTNSQNSKIISRNKSGVRNIYLENGRYRVRFKINNHTKSFGSYSTLQEAHIVSEKMRKTIQPECERSIDNDSLNEYIKNGYKFIL